MTPDYRLIAELEYELGITDEKPPGGPQSVAAVGSILKAAYLQGIDPRVALASFDAERPLSQ